MGAKLLLIQLLLMGGKLVPELATAIDRETKWTAIKRPSVAHARERTSFAKAIDRGNTQ